MIEPTVGRIVWYWPQVCEGIPQQPDQPLSATIACVWSNDCVNLQVIDANGFAHSRTSVLLVQPEALRPDAGFCEWMPYQKGQAAKNEQLQEQIDKVRANAQEPD